MKVGSLFSGIGGIDLAFERQGFSVAWQCEIDSHAQAVLRRHWPGVTLYGDVTTMNGTNVEPVDIVTFGSPCQDLSVAGKRGGLEGERSGLFHEAVRLIAEMREATHGRYPAFALWENVPGALSSSNGWDFAAVLDSLAHVGAVDIGYRVLDAQFFGVPQRRRRIYLVADFGGHRAGAILALTEGGSRDTAESGTTGQGTPARVVAGVGAVGLDSVAKPLGAHSGGGAQDDLDNTTFVVADIRNGAIDHDVTMTLQAKESGSISVNTIPHLVANGNRVDNAITAKLAKGTGGPSGDEGNHLIVAPVDFVNVTSKTNRTRVEFGSPANTLHQAPQSVVMSPVPIREAWGMSDDYLPSNAGIGEPGDPMATLRSGKQHAVGLATGIRRLTPVECERLMGLDDDWAALTDTGQPIADTHRYRLCGNSVAVPVVASIAKNIMEVMSCQPQ